MAYNKEYMIFVLDVRQSTPEDFKQKSIKCCSEIMKRKICTAKKDYMSFVLVGTQRTFNDVNTNVCHDGYLNVTQYAGEMEIPSWQLLMNFYQFVNETATDKGEWLDALVVAFSMLKAGSENKKVQRLRLVLFYDFNDGINSYDCFEDVTKSLLEHNVDLIVVSPNIAYIDNEANDFLPQAIINSGKRSQQQVENEKYALRLVPECNAKLSNLKQAEFFISKSDNKRPWTWNSELRIGTKINIRITGIIAAKNECTIKLKKVWNEDDEVLTREWGYSINGNRITPNEDDLMEGYMLGGTPIPYDESANDDKIKLPIGLTFMGFIPRKSVYDEYYSGDTVYMIIHKRDDTRSAKIINALVRVLLKAERAILCWKVYSEKFNRPKMVILMPNEIKDDSPASFYMYDLAYYEQYHFFEFPKLASKKSECSKEQLDAIDNLIDSMDLTIETKDSQTPRETLEKDLLPFNNLPHIFEKNFMDLMERKILCKASEDDEFFEEILKDKNFAEIFWKVPEQIEEKAKDAAKEVKRVFPLKISNDWLEKAKAEEKIKMARLTQTLDEEASTSASQLSFDHVRSAAPAEDFELLLKACVFPIKNSTQRDVKFNHYASQMRAVIRDLIFKPESFAEINVDKIVAALNVYRKRCFIFNAFDDYNTWISSIKTEVVNRRMAKFWHEVIVRHELGLCFIGETSLDEQIKEKEFYSLEFSDSEVSASNVDAARMEMDDSDMDNLLANLP
ncbi:X-ray repair cross-complementing protein 5 [Lucilia cuprina]|uniref:X-ray repair cross-complementing protein 5 n=1 Tax=Lucilia cuprina TaxID=7375 RepID=UPI001F06D082|nr:X-ray repair cross-complementing protein 5 [Lucilia cuprina]